MSKKKITFNMLATKLPKAEKKVIQFDGFEIEVQHRLPIKNTISFVNDVVNMCTDVEAGTYRPELLEFATRCAILMAYAGFEIPKDFDKAYRVVFETDIIEVIMHHIDTRQLEMLKDAVREEICHVARMMTATATSEMIKLVAKMEEMVEHSTEVTKQLHSGDLQEAFANVLNIYQHIEEADATNADAVEMSDNVIQIPRGE